jgi:hypothetical protein
LAHRGYTGDFDLRQRAEQVSVQSYLDLHFSLPAA